MKLGCLAGLAILLSTSIAAAAPSTLTFAGRLSTSSGPVDGQVTVQFRLFADGTGGTAVWGPESHTVTADAGLVYANLGTLSTLDASVFNGQVMYLEIQVGAEVLTPRLTINSVPYALQSDTANLLGGAIAAGDVVTGVTGGTNITATKTGNNVTVGLVTTGCANGQVYKWNGSAFACAADAVGPTYTGGTGIAVSGSTISLNTTGCSAGYVWKYNGSAFTCAPDATGITTEVDGIIGNEVTNVTNASLVRAGAGTAASPYTLALNTGNANSWTAMQTFGEIDVNGTARLGIQRVSGAVVTIDTVQSNCPNYGGATCYYGIAAATCSSGRLLGGGCNLNGGYVTGNLHRSFPSTDTTWTCIATSSVSSSTITAWGICARVAP